MYWCALINYRDRLSIDNNGYESYGLPFTPCSDLAGKVEAVGTGVSRFAVGDRVINNFNTGWVDGPPPASMAWYRALADPCLAYWLSTSSFRRLG